MYIVVLSPRVAPGLLTREAWRLLESADVVYVTDRHHATALAAGGITSQYETAPIRNEQGAVWVTCDPEWAKSSAEILRDQDIDVYLVPGSFDLPGARVLDLVNVMDRLRRECPWTIQQTHASLSHYLLEETHEVLEALDDDQTDHLKEELGDLLMQIVFHAVISAEADGWTIDDVAHAITEKLIFRNPHVFANAKALTAEEVDANWQRLKGEEKKRDSIWEGIPNTLPALAAAAKILRRLDPIQFNRDALGERFLALVVEANEAGIDPEGLVRQTLARLTR